MHPRQAALITQATELTNVTAEGVDSRLPRLERLVKAVELEAQQMATSLGQYKQDPAKYKPQLDNVATAAKSIMMDLRVLLRTLGKEVE
jgi:hypothetical protein